jgi:hypothetical protein
MSLRGFFASAGAAVIALTMAAGCRAPAPTSSENSKAQTTATADNQQKINAAFTEARKGNWSALGFYFSDPNIFDKEELASGFRAPDRLEHLVKMYEAFAKTSTADPLKSCIAAPEAYKLHDKPDLLAQLSNEQKTFVRFLNQGAGHPESSTSIMAVVNHDVLLCATEPKRQFAGSYTVNENILRLSLQTPPGYDPWPASLFYFMFMEEATHVAQRHVIKNATTPGKEHFARPYELMWNYFHEFQAKIIATRATVIHLDLQQQHTFLQMLSKPNQFAGFDAYATQLVFEAHNKHGREGVNKDAGLLSEAFLKYFGTEPVITYFPQNCVIYNKIDSLNQRRIPISTYIKAFNTLPGAKGEMLKELKDFEAEDLHALIEDAFVANWFDEAFDAVLTHKPVPLIAADIIPECKP